jgi:hypothetical protein
VNLHNTNDERLIRHYAEYKSVSPPSSSCRIQVIYSGNALTEYNRTQIRPRSTRKLTRDSRRSSADTRPPNRICECSLRCCRRHEFLARCARNKRAYGWSCVCSHVSNRESLDVCWWNLEWLWRWIIHTPTSSVLNTVTESQIKSMATVRILGVMCANSEVPSKEIINK